jgi:hypothetical protein
LDFVAWEHGISAEGDGPMLSTFHRWKRFLAKLGLSKARNFKATRQKYLTRRLRLEPLEDRQLLSITVNTLIDERDNDIFDADVSLRDAILEAPAGEIINFSTNPVQGLNGGTINLLPGLGEIAFSKSLTIDASMLSNGISIDASASDPTPDQDNGDGIRIFDLSHSAAGLPVTLIGLTLTGGDEGLYDSGGAIRSSGRLVVRGCTITGNSTLGLGGAIHSEVAGSGTVLTIEQGTVIEHNKAGGRGGGIYVQVNDQSSVDIRQSEFVQNGSNFGGAIYAVVGNDASLTIDEAAFELNTGYRGGAIFTEINGGSVHFGADSTFATNSASDKGGAVYAIINAGMLDIADSDFVTNQAAAGGGIYANINAESSMSIANSKLTGNQALNGVGGAVLSYAYVNGSLSIVGSEIEGNSALDGGGVFARASGNYSNPFATPRAITISRSLVSGNTALNRGGGIYTRNLAGTETVVEESRITGNHVLTSGHAERNGGGIYAYLYGPTSGTDKPRFTITRSTVDSNEADHEGGGIFVCSKFSGSFIALNTTISSNDTLDPSTGSGGGMMIARVNDPGEFLDAYLRNVTIKGNVSANGAGVATANLDELRVRIANSIISENLDHAENPNNLDGRVHIDHSTLSLDEFRGNLIGSGSTVRDLDGVIVDPTVWDDANIASDTPGLGTIANNGGPTHTHALMPGSLAIDAGLNALATNPLTNVPFETDQRGIGFSRFVDVPGVHAPGEIVDIGAYEATSVTVAPMGVDLVDDSTYDTGRFSDDNITNRDNSSAAKNLQFLVTGTIPGATINVYANNGSDPVLIGSANANTTTTMITTNGTVDILDGTRTITATQTEPMRSESSPVQNTVMIDTGLPTTPGMLDLETEDTGNPTDNVTSDPTPTFDWSASSDGTGSGIWGYYWAVDNSTPQNGGTFVESPTVTATATVPDDGSYTMNVVAVDVAGNFSSPPSTLEFTIDRSGPRIVDVLFDSVTLHPQTGQISGRAWAGEPFSFDEIAPFAKQLAPIYVQGVNAIQIAFSEDVELDGSELKLYSSNLHDASPTELGVVFRGIDSEHIATWTTPLLDDDKYRIDLAAMIADVADNVLNGEWSHLINGTLDDYRDDMAREFPSGDALEGTAGNLFQFKFAILAGDYNQDGWVNAADHVVWAQHEPNEGPADGNRDGIVDLADRAVYTNNFNDRLPGRNWMGDYNDDERVDHDDFLEWKATFGLPGDPNRQDADGNGNGIVDAADYDVWRKNHDLYEYGGAWYMGTSGSGSSQVGAAPTVINVTLSGSDSGHDPYAFAGVVGSGEQLRTVPVAEVDTISITFSEAVEVAEWELWLVGLRTGNQPTVVDFSYNAATMTATWRFDDLVANDHYLISLGDSVMDVDGNFLDGEWINPDSLSTTNPLVSEFPSGNGQVGGSFNFVVTLLSGDANRDNAQEMMDLDLVWANWGMSGGSVLWTDGDVNGDHAVDGIDFNFIDEPQGAGIYYVLQSMWVLADLNGDFTVNDVDLDILRDNMGMSDPTLADGDLNGDGDVSFTDLDLALAQYGLKLALVG